LEGLGHWLQRRWFACQRKKSIAEAELQKLNIPEDLLRSEWEAQVSEQTKPAPRMFNPHTLLLWLILEFI
jgi:hypothetical protein